MGLTPANIYQPSPLAIENYDFEQSPGTLPPTGWQLGGVGLNTSATLSYDTSTPYEGANSLKIVATAQFAGVSATEKFLVTPGQVYGVEASLWSLSGDQANVELVFSDINGNQLAQPPIRPLIHTIENSWQLLGVQGTAPAGAVTAQVQCYMSGASGGTGEFDVVQVTLLSNAIPYYLSKITSEYQTAPDFLQFLAFLLQPIVDAGICAAGMNAAFALATPAVGSQLDILGQILGVVRTLPFSPVGVSALTTEAVSATGSQTVTTNNTTYMQIGVAQSIDTGGNQENVTPTAIVQGVSFTAVFAKTHLSGVAVTTVAPSPILDDAHYLTLLQAKVLANQFNGQYMGANSVLWQAWQALFPGGRIYITDNQNMTATIFLVGAFDPLYQQMITNGLIIPRCQAVEFIFEFAELPIFGWGNLNPTFVQGWGTGSGAYPGGNWA